MVHSCCEAWEELGKGDRCEFQSSLDTKPGEVGAKSKEVKAVSGGFHPDPTKPQTPADQPKCKLRLALSTATYASLKTHKKTKGRVPKNESPPSVHHHLRCITTFGASPTLVLHHLR